MPRVFADANSSTGLAEATRDKGAGIAGSGRGGEGPAWLLAAASQGLAALALGWRRLSDGKEAAGRRGSVSWGGRRWSTASRWRGTGGVAGGGAPLRQRGRRVGGGEPRRRPARAMRQRREAGARRGGAATKDGGRARTLGRRRGAPRAAARERAPRARHGPERAGRRRGRRLPRGSLRFTEGGGTDMSRRIRTCPAAERSGARVSGENIRENEEGGRFYS